MCSLFISDLHLHHGRPELTQALHDFCQQQVEPQSKLFILGDLFEAWLGDDLGLAMYAEVVALLARQTQQGTQIYFISGNRDFLVGEAFSRTTGVTLLPEAYQLQMGQDRILLLHGDTLCTDDTDYQKFRQQVRQPQWQIEFLAQPADVRIAIANQYRQQSQSLTAQKPESIMDVSEAEVLCQLQQHDCNVLIHGHTHRPKVHRYNTTKDILQRIVLGDWDKHFYYLKWPDEGAWQLLKQTI